MTKRQLVESAVTKIVRKVIRKRKQLREWEDDEEEYGDEEYDDEEGSDEPQDDDLVIRDVTRGGYDLVVIGGKQIGHFEDQDDAEEAARAWMKKNNFFPNLWYQNERGSMDLL